jgi:hypothetical protein
VNAIAKYAARFAFALGAANACAPLAVQAATTQNLLINGDAELHRCTRDWTAQTPVPGWRVVRGAVSVLCYSAFAFAHETLATPSAPPAGDALFSGIGADAAMEQTVDIGLAATGVDAGKVNFALSGWLGGWGDRPERATLTAIFLDASGRGVGEPFIIANVDAKARGGRTGLVERETRGEVPGGARSIVVTVGFVSGMTSIHNAYADNLTLTLSGEVGAVAPAVAEPPAAKIPKLDHAFVLMMENMNYADVVHTDGREASITAGMPYLSSLAAKGVILTGMWGIYHPSDQNYVAMIAGDTYRYGPIFYPDFDLPETHIGDVLNAAGKTWAGYVQHMMTPCNLKIGPAGAPWYAPDDEPFAQFHDVIANSARCDATLRDLTDFTAAARDDKLPAFAWLAADGWWDGEGAWYESFDVAFSLAKQDEFIKSALAPLFASPAWKTSRSLVVLTWDETDGWGWPDNHIPALIFGSPGLVREGAVLDGEYNGYDVLRTVEASFGVRGLGRFDEYARGLSGVFAENPLPVDAVDPDLKPALSAATRGGIDDTFGMAATPAAVALGDPLELIAPVGAGVETYVNVTPLGEFPAAQSPAYRFDGGGRTSIATGQLAPGFYGAWLRRQGESPGRAAVPFLVLPPAIVNAKTPGVEILDLSPGQALSVREGSNFIVRYCGAPKAENWIGVFPVGTPPAKMTKAAVNVLSNWLKTPALGQTSRCGEAMAYAAELTPGVNYEVDLMQGDGKGPAQPVGRRAEFSLIPALPRASQ